MQALYWNPRFAVVVNRSCRKASTLRRAAFSSDSSNQSRDGLPRFFIHLLPSSKGSAVRVQGDEFWHMAKVLRLTTDDRSLHCSVIYFGIAGHYIADMSFR